MLCSAALPTIHAPTHAWHDAHCPSTCSHLPASAPDARALQVELGRLGGYVPPGRTAGHVVIMSYDVFRLSHALVASKKFELVVCDEAHRLKASPWQGGRGGRRQCSSLGGGRWRHACGAAAARLLCLLLPQPSLLLMLLLLPPHGRPASPWPATVKRLPSQLHQPCPALLPPACLPAACRMDSPRSTRPSPPCPARCACC
jgi:hypothetical protein